MDRQFHNQEDIQRCYKDGQEVIKLLEEHFLETTRESPATAGKRHVLGVIAMLGNACVIIGAAFRAFKVKNISTGYLVIPGAIAALGTGIYIGKINYDEKRNQNVIAGTILKEMRQFMSESEPLVGNTTPEYYEEVDTLMERRSDDAGVMAITPAVVTVVMEIPCLKTACSTFIEMFKRHCNWLIAGGVVAGSLWSIRCYWAQRNKGLQIIQTPHTSDFLVRLSYLNRRLADRMKAIESSL